MPLGHVERTVRHQMQQCEFHLMPYRPLDMAERHKHRAAWVVLPRHALRPGEGRARSTSPDIDQLVHAEELGFDDHRGQRAPPERIGRRADPNLIANEMLVARTGRVPEGRG